LKICVPIDHFHFIFRRIFLLLF